MIMSAHFKWGLLCFHCGVSSRRWMREGACLHTAFPLALSMGLLRFSLFEAVEKSVRYLIGTFLLPFEMAGGGMALRDILVVKVQAVTFDTTIPLAVRIV